MVRLVSALVLCVSLLWAGLMTSAQEASPAATELGSDWPTLHGNAARTGASADPGPAGDLELRWRFATAISTLNASPAVVDGVVYAASGLFATGGMTALDLAAGRPIWATELSDNFFASSPAVADGVVYAGGLRGNVFALDAGTGSLLWQTQLGAGTTSSPAVSDDTLFIGADDDLLYALDTATGEQRWTFQAGGGGQYTIDPSPAVEDGIVLVSSLDADQDASLFALDAATGEEQWRFEPETPGLTTPAVSDGVVYVAGEGGQLSALNLTDGAEIWSAAVGRAGSAPAVAEGLVAVHTDGQLVALDAATGAERWRAQIGGIWSAPVIAGGSVYAGGNGLAFENGLYAFDAATGALRWQLKDIGAVIASPALTGDTVIVSSSDGAIYAIGDTDATGPGSGRTSTGALLGPISFATGVDESGALIDPADAFPAETASLNAGFAFLGVADGAQLHVIWLLDGEVLVERDDVWNRGPAGYASENISANAGALPPGTYEIVISLDSEEIRRGTTTVGP